MFFRPFCDADGNQYLGHSWLMEPSEVKVQAPKRPPPLTFEQFQDLANEKGVGEQYQTLFDFFSERANQSGRTPSNVAFAFKMEGGTKAALSVYPKFSSKQEGLYTDVRADRLASVFGVNEADVQAALPGESRGVSDRHQNYLGGETHYFRSVEDVRKLTTTLRGNSEEEVIADDTRKPE